MTCLRCDGSGEVCAECRLNEAECECDGMPDLIECPVCDGEGETFGAGQCCDDCGDELDEDDSCSCEDDDDDFDEDEEGLGRTDEESY